MSTEPAYLLEQKGSVALSTPDGPRLSPASELANEDKYALIQGQVHTPGGVSLELYWRTTSENSVQEKFVGFTVLAIQGRPRSTPG
jgi:hypothetical protein